MTQERNVADIPATERAVVGLCHDLNDQLAAVSAYAFLLRRRGALFPPLVDARLELPGIFEARAPEHQHHRHHQVQCGHQRPDPDQARDLGAEAHYGANMRR